MICSFSKILVFNKNYGRTISKFKDREILSPRTLLTIPISTLWASLQTPEESTNTFTFPQSLPSCAPILLPLFSQQFQFKHSLASLSCLTYPVTQKIGHISGIHGNKRRETLESTHKFPVDLVFVFLLSFLYIFLILDMIVAGGFWEIDKVTEGWSPWQSLNLGGYGRKAASLWQKEALTRKLISSTQIKLLPRL